MVRAEQIESGLVWRGAEERCGVRKAAPARTAALMSIWTWLGENRNQNELDQNCAELCPLENEKYFAPSGSSDKGYSFWISYHSRLLRIFIRFIDDATKDTFLIKIYQSIKNWYERKTANYELLELLMFLFRCWKHFLTDATFRWRNCSYERDCRPTRSNKL